MSIEDIRNIKGEITTPRPNLDLFCNFYCNLFFLFLPQQYFLCKYQCRYHVSPLTEHNLLLRVCEN
jgi:hypothetical protein